MAPTAERRFFASGDIQGPAAPLRRIELEVLSIMGSEIATAPTHCRRARKDDGGRL